MASQINYESVDNTYPVAGIDNDSQGFRNNFSVIKNSLQAAKSEIDELQLKSAKTDSPNNFNGNNIIAANFVNCTDEVFISNISSESTQPTIDVTRAGYHQVRISTSSNTPLSLIFIEWPNDGKVSSVIVELVNVGPGTRVVTFSAGPGTLYYDPSYPISRNISVNASNEIQFFEAWSPNGGQSVYIKFLGKFVQ